ncbi:RNA-binding protein Pasilla-like isoform X3 [Argiope bruennichi]|uniref:RNA-binding protein Nova-1 like protein n=2 Tax=Argiope bruennichi TaxID=94029 RepID=A0A8T0FJX7_ARGBR|nr:RNA-binding protein Pasilla-like isoform X3 [Argiope bruennichi]KAF8790752.1 RNA-binding protein Nova-1 like protein [Argiope bruennichi]
MTSEVQYHDQGQANGTYHFKILVPSVAAGAIIGKGGETIAQLQKDAGARVKMSKATDFYPGTTERVCLISGNIDGIIRIHEFIMEKIKEKPDPNAKMAIDFDHKQPAEREKQVKILVPNSTAGMIIGKGGSYIKQIKEESGAYVQISQKSKDHALAERCITVIGEMENNKTACNMILAKVVEDPQSGSCLNVSYADVTGPVANFNPTGSPFANPSSVPSSVMNNSNTSYNSNGSLNSLSPTVTDSFHSSQTGTSHTGILPFAGIGMSSSTIPPTNATQIIEAVKNMLRGNGYSEQALSEISAAMNTLASYGLLSLGLGILNGINGASVVGNLGMGMTGSAASSNALPTTGITNQEMYTSASAVPGIETTCNSVTTTTPMGAGSSIFGPIGSLGNGISGLGLGPGFTSPTTSRSSDRYLVQAEAAVFEPFRRTSPALASPSAAALPVNNNSFGLGTCMTSASSSLRKSPAPNDRPMGDATKIEIEVGENIVGAILGPGGKALVEIQRFSGANIQISKKGIFAPGTRNRIVTITGLSSAVNTAQYLIERQIAEEEAKRAQQNAMGVLR